LETLKPQLGGIKTIGEHPTKKKKLKTPPEGLLGGTQPFPALETKEKSKQQHRSKSLERGKKMPSHGEAAALKGKERPHDWGEPGTPKAWSAAPVGRQSAAGDRGKTGLLGGSLLVELGRRKRTELDSQIGETVCDGIIEKTNK